MDGEPYGGVQLLDVRPPLDAVAWRRIVKAVAIGVGVVVVAWLLVPVVLWLAMQAAR